MLTSDIIMGRPHYDITSAEQHPTLMTSNATGIQSYIGEGSHACNISHCMAALAVAIAAATAGAGAGAGAGAVAGAATVIIVGDNGCGGNGGGGNGTNPMFTG